MSLFFLRGLTAAVGLLIIPASLPVVGGSVYAAASEAGRGGSSAAASAGPQRDVLLKATAVSPGIVSQPQSQSVASGTDVTFTVTASGTEPLTYQWQVDNQTISGATNATLFLPQVQTSQVGDYRVVVANWLGAATSHVAQLRVDDDLTFRVTKLLTNGAIAMEASSVVGSSAEGIAISSMNVFLTGDNGTGRWDAEYLTGGVLLPNFFYALVSDLKTDTVYTLASNNVVFPFGGIEVNSLIQLDSTTGAVTTNRIDLSTNLVMAVDSGFFSGYGRIIMVVSGRIYHIALPSGQVTDLGIMPSLPHNAGNSWAYWGLAEYVGGALSLVYVRDSQSIVRTRLPDGTTTLVQEFADLGNMASLAIAPSLGRWYFHHSGFSQFRPTGSPNQTIGSAKADYTTDPGFPTIRRDPTDQISYPGGTAAFTVFTHGSEPLFFQWQFDGEAMAGATNRELMLANIQTTNAGSYRVVVSNHLGVVVSGEAWLTVYTAPVILHEPANTRVYPGSNATFTVVAEGAPPMRYQWVVDGANLSGSTNATLIVTNAGPLNVGSYSVYVGNEYGQVGSAGAWLELITTPEILAQPPAQTVMPGTTVTLTVVADGAPPLSYQWQWNGTILAVGPDASLVLTNVHPTNSGLYSVLVTNAYGNILSSNAELRVYGAPEITAPPQDVSVLPGSNAVFTVQVEGAIPLTYQWRFEGIDIPLATNNLLVLTNITASNAGRYSVHVSNIYGTAVSAEASLTVVEYVDDQTRFQIVSLSANGSYAIEHNSVTGDDRGGIAVSSSRVFVTGDSATGRFSAADLSGAAEVGDGLVYDSLISDLRTERVYVLGNGTNVLGYGGYNATANCLLELDRDTGVLTGRRVNFTMDILYNQGGYGAVGLFSGYGRVVIHNGLRVYSIQLPSGFVSDLGAMSVPSHNYTETWAYWGVAEQFNGSNYLVYIASGTATPSIVRARVPDGATSVVSTFSSLSDMASFTVSIRRGRWYFHHEGTSQFRSGDETVGYANATFSVDSGIYPSQFVWSPLNVMQPVRSPIPVTLTALTSLQGVASNFHGSVTLGGYSSGGTPVAIQPTSISNFVNGVWTGEVTVLQPSASMYLRAVDEFGVAGNSTVFTATTNDFAVFITDSPDPLPIGQELTYSLSVNNAGPGPATGVLLTNLLPPEVELVSLTTSQGSWSNFSGTLVCELGTIGVGARAELTIVIKPAVPGTMTNLVMVQRNEPDPNPANNVAVVTTTVLAVPLLVDDTSIVETDTETNYATFTVRLLRTVTNTVTVRYATANGLATATGTYADYIAVSGLLTFLPGETTQTVSVAVRGDRLFETNETFYLNLSNPTNASLGDAQGVCTILNDDAMPSVTINDATIVEGNSGNASLLFRVVLSAVSGQQILIPYSTSNGTAVAGTDFVAKSGVVTFPAGSSLRTQNIAIAIVGDTLSESNEFFQVNLFAATNGLGMVTAFLERSNAVGTILADDGIGVVDKFVWDPVPSPQLPNTPIPVTISARDFFDLPITNFTGQVSLSAARGAVVNKTVGTGTETNQYPFGTYWHDERAQIIYLASEIGAAGLIRSLALDVTQPPSRAMNNFTIRMKHTPLSRYTDYSSAVWQSADWTVVYKTDLAFTSNGWVTFDLTTPFPYNGTDNLMVDFSFNNTTYTYPDGYCRGTVQNENRVAWYQTDSGYGDPLEWGSGTSTPSPNLGSVTPNLRLLIDSTVSFPLQPTSSGNFVSGVWTGAVILFQPATNVQLTASDAAQHTGVSNPFDVANFTGPDVTLHLFAETTQTWAGSNVTLLLQITNRGPGIAHSVVVSNPVPAGLALLSTAMNRGRFTNFDNTLTYSLNSMPVGTTMLITSIFRAEIEGTVTNEAWVSAEEADPLPANNRAFLALEVLCSDCDHDGLPDAWELAHGLSPQNAADAALDPDGDGLTNLQEYLAGTDPADGSSTLRLQLRSVSTTNVLSFQVQAHRSYSLLWKESLNASNWTKLVDVPPLTQPATIEISDPLPPAATRLYRLITPQSP